MQQAPRYNFIAEDIDENNLKRIETKSGNRIHISDVPGKETVFLATPQHTSISMTEMSDETGNHLLFLHSNGDIVLNAPNGRVHINSKLYSKKVGAPGKAEAAGAIAPAANSSANLHDAPTLLIAAALTAPGSPDPCEALAKEDRRADRHGQATVWKQRHPWIEISVPRADPRAKRPQNRGLDQSRTGI